MNQSKLPRRSSLPLITTIFISFTFLVLFAIFLWPQCGDARQTVYKEQCRNNLKAIGLAIHAYIEKHNDLPKDNDGKFSIDVLKQFDPNLSFKCPCGNDHNGIDYEFAKDISLKDFKDSSRSQKVILAEKNANHFGYRILILADGSVRPVEDRQEKPRFPNFPWDFKAHDES